ncbi:MAG: hypothetical protein HZY76_01050 [Anaerolineae bacterium]|nr:MAG: hypothetical protein HZY76_01050 [Anaerolineae bacterium]
MDRRCTCRRTVGTLYGDGVVTDGVLADVEIVIVEAPGALTGLGLNCTVAPSGSPDALSVTLPLYPPEVTTETV